MYNKNSYLNSQFSSPFSSSPTNLYSRDNASVLDLNSNEILFQHNNGVHNFFNNHYLAANNAPFLETAALFNNLNQELEILNEDPSSVTGPIKQNIVPRKDRHSKIYTSQGPRDRRVRLSIGIARKFFDLQELLGFDKPSKTLDWLLSKSKAAIKELVHSKTTSYECEEVLSNGSSLRVPDLKGKSIAKGSSSTSNFAKESRAKARARARERTKEKMCIKQMNEANRNLLQVSGVNRNHLEVSGGVHHYPVMTCFGVNDKDLIEEIKRKLMKQQMHIPSGNYASENWDYSNSIDQSSQLCAILDHHKFIN